MECIYTNTLYDVNVKVKELILAGNTILTVRATSMDFTQFMISYISGQYIDFNDDERDEFTTTFKDFDELFAGIKYVFSKSGEIRYIRFDLSKKILFFKYREQRPARLITDIIGGAEYIDSLEHSIVNMQIHFRSQAMVRNTLCSYYDCTAEEAWLMLSKFNLTVPELYPTLEDWMKSGKYPGFKIQKWYNSELDIDTLDD